MPPSRAPAEPRGSRRATGHAGGDGDGAPRRAGHAILHAMVDPDEIPPMPHICIDQAWKFGIAKVKETLLGIGRRWRARAIGPTPRSA